MCVNGNFKGGIFPLVPFCTAIAPLSFIFYAVPWDGADLKFSQNTSLATERLKPQSVSKKEKKITGHFMVLDRQLTELCKPTSGCCWLISRRLFCAFALLFFFLSHRVELAVPFKASFFFFSQLLRCPHNRKLYLKSTRYPWDDGAIQGLITKLRVYVCGSSLAKGILTWCVEGWGSASLSLYLLVVFMGWRTVRGGLVCVSQRLRHH